MKFRPLSIPYNIKASDIIAEDEDRFREYIFPIHHHEQPFEHTKEKIIDDCDEKMNEAKDEKSNPENDQNDTLLTPKSTHLRAEKSVPETIDFCDNVDADACLEEDESNDRLTQVSNSKKGNQLDEEKVLSLLGPVLYPSDYALRPISHDSSIKSFFNAINSNGMRTNTYKNNDDNPQVINTFHQRNPDGSNKSNHVIFHKRFFKFIFPYSDKDMKKTKNSNYPYNINNSNSSQNLDNNISNHSYRNQQEFTSKSLISHLDGETDKNCWKKQIEQSITNVDMPFVPHVAKYPYTIEKQQVSLSSKLKSSTFTESIKHMIIPMTGKNYNKLSSKKSSRKKRKTPLLITDNKTIRSLSTKKKTNDSCSTLQKKSTQLSPVKYCMIKYLSKMKAKVPGKLCEAVGEQNKKLCDKKDKRLLKLKSEWKRQRVLRESQNLLSRNSPKRVWFESFPSAVSSRSQILKYNIRLDSGLPLPMKSSDQMDHSRQSITKSEKFSYFLPDCKLIFDQMKCSRFIRRLKDNSKDFAQGNKNHMQDKADFESHHILSKKFNDICTMKRKIFDQEFFLSHLQLLTQSLISKAVDDVGFKKYFTKKDISSVTDPGKIFHFHFAPYIPKLIKLNSALPVNLEKKEMKSLTYKEEKCLSFQPTTHLVRRLFSTKCKKKNRLPTKIKEPKTLSCSLKSIPWTNDIYSTLNKSLSNLVDNTMIFIPHPSKKKAFNMTVKMYDQTITDKEGMKYLDNFSTIDYEKEAKEKINSGESEKSKDILLPASMQQRHKTIERVIFAGCVQKKDSYERIEYRGFLSGEKVPFNIFQNRYNITKNVRLVHQCIFNRDIWQIFRRCLFYPTLRNQPSERNLMGQISISSIVSFILCHKMANIFKKSHENKLQYQLICAHLLNSKRHPYLLFDYQRKQRSVPQRPIRQTSIPRISSDLFFQGLTTNAWIAQIETANTEEQLFCFLNHISNIISPINEDYLGIRVEFVHLSHKIAEFKSPNSSKNSQIKLQQSSFFLPPMNSNIENETSFVPKIGNSNVALIRSEKATKKKRKKRRAERKMRKDKKKMRKKITEKLKRKGKDVISDDKCQEVMNSPDNSSFVMEHKTQSIFSHDSIPQNKRVKADREYGDNRDIQSKMIDTHEHFMPLQPNDVSGHISPDIVTKEHQNLKLNRFGPDFSNIIYNTPNGDCQQSHSLDSFLTPECDKMNHSTCKHGSKRIAIISNEGNNLFNGTKEFLSLSNSTSHSSLKLLDKPNLKENVDNWTIQEDSPFQASQRNDNAGVKYLNFNNEDQPKLIHEKSSNLFRRVVLCSENFLETYGEVVSDLARGRWMEKIVKKSQDSPKQCFTNLEESKESEIKCEITLCDCPLVDESGIDLELPSRTSIIVQCVSLWCSDHKAADNNNNIDFNLKSDCDSHQAKSFVRRLVELISTGRYVNVQILLCLDVPISSEIANTISFVQNALLLPSGHLSPYLCLRHVMPEALSFVIAETILSNGVNLPYNMNLIENIYQDAETQESVRFLLSLSPTLTVLGAFECVMRYSTFSHCIPNQANEMNHVFDLQSFLFDITNSNLSKFNELNGQTEITSQAIRHIILAVTTNTRDQIF